MRQGSGVGEASVISGGAPPRGLKQDRTPRPRHGRPPPDLLPYTNRNNRREEKKRPTEQGNRTQAPSVGGDKSRSYVRKISADRLLGQLVVSPSTREAIFEHYPEAKEDQILFRFIVYALVGTLRDRDTGLLRIGQPVLEWIAGRPLHSGSANVPRMWAKDVIAYLQGRLDGFEYIKHIPAERERLLKSDGLSDGLRSIFREDLRRRLDEVVDPVDVLSGKGHHAMRASRERKRIKDQLREEEAEAPSQTARYIFHRMNFHRTSHRYTKSQKYIPGAIEYAREMQIDVKEIAGETEQDRQERIEQLRQRYLSILRTTWVQPQPFYKYSRKKRTDRIFGYNPSALRLPGKVRKILTRDFVTLDLKSAHLVIAASLWNVPEVLERLEDETYSVWGDLMGYFGLGHLDPSESLYEWVKKKLKHATYSVIYGMPGPNIKGAFTLGMRVMLGDNAGQRLSEHWLIRKLLEARRRELERIEVVGFAKTATEIVAEVSEDHDARSVMATVAQSYEQEIMKEILVYEQEHVEKRKAENRKKDFQVMLWLHDGAQLHFTRNKNLHIREIQRRVEQRGRDLGIPICLELE